MADPMDGEGTSLSSAENFVTSTYSRYATCGMTFGPINALVTAVMGEEEDLSVALANAANTWPMPLTRTILLLIGVSMALYGFALVRPFNFAAGAYLGGTLTLLLLGVVAPPSTTCWVIVVLPLLAAIAAGVVCASKRSSLFAVFGLVAGEVIGRVFYNLLLAPVGLPELLAYSCIGFFAVLCSVGAYYVGDVVWIFATAFIGAHLGVSALLEMLVVPWAPGFSVYLRISWPDLSMIHSAEYVGQYLSYLTGDLALLFPFLLVCGLAVAGFYAQLKLIKTGKTKAMKDAALVMK